MFDGASLDLWTEPLQDEVVQFGYNERGRDELQGRVLQKFPRRGVIGVRRREIREENPGVEDDQSSPNPFKCSSSVRPLTPSGKGSVIIPAPVMRRVNSLSTARRMISASVSPRRSASAVNRAFIASGRYTVVRCMPYIVPYVGSRTYDVVWGTALRATTIAHHVLDKVSGGRLMRRFPGGSQVVWITTLGRKSGEWRRTPLLGVPVKTEDFHGWGIAGSNAGQEKVPGWVFNVRANPSGTIQIDDEAFECRFTEVDGDLAWDIYERLGNSWSSYRMYERNIKRAIPIFVAEIAGTQTETGEPS